MLVGDFWIVLAPLFFSHWAFEKKRAPSSVNTQVDTKWYGHPWQNIFFQQYHVNCWIDLRPIFKEHQCGFPHSNDTAVQSFILACFIWRRNIRAPSLTASEFLEKIVLFLVFATTCTVKIIFVRLDEDLGTASLWISFAILTSRFSLEVAKIRYKGLANYTTRRMGASEIPRFLSIWLSFRTTSPNCFDLTNRFRS